MAEILCPNCGKPNPSSLRVCQFCQAPLPSESSLRTGDQPTKKKTGELEPALPDWLKDLRQQAKAAEEETASEAATMPKIQKEEPPDLLAGLASQSSKSEAEDIPDWLASLSPKPKEKPAEPFPAKPDSVSFTGLDQSVSGSKSELEMPASSEQDELSDWFAKASEQPAEPFSLEEQEGQPPSTWGLENSNPPAREAAPEPEEDLSWLHNLEAESKKTGELASREQQDDWSSAFGSSSQGAASSQDDLSWLDQLGALPASEQPKPETPDAGDDLGWLDAFSGASQVAQPSSPSASQDDLGWLSAFAETPETQQNESTPAASQDDLSWLGALGAASQLSKPVQEQPASDDLDWLHDLQGTPGTTSGSLADEALTGTKEPQELPHVSPFSPGNTGSLEEANKQDLPDWLKSATEETSMPLGPEALNRIREDKEIPAKPENDFSRALFGAAFLAADKQTNPPQPEAESSTTEAASLFNEGVNSLFSEEMPDWLSQPQAVENQPVEDIGINAEGGEALSPAELPSWVKAMRPVEAMIAATNTDLIDDQPVEREGPLAGLKGVLPAVALGSLRRPHPIPLTLQATNEQQASAGILEQILIAETTPRPLVSETVMISQRRLRWVISGLLLFVLAAVIFSGTQIMPVPPVLLPEANNVTNVVTKIADNAPVLVILDYEPALAGEMEAASGPLLDQLVQLHHPYLSFIATSPSGNALVERLLLNTNISRPDGTGYIPGQNYTNMGYLPGGESGVLAFLQSPQEAIPTSPVLEFSEYAAILLLTDHSESARVWVEQLSTFKQADPALASQPLLAVASAQTGPMLQPYYSSGQVNGLISGLPSAARYELLNNNRPGTARSYWDAFGVGMMMAVLLIVIGSIWSVYSGIRANHVKTAEE